MSTPATLRVSATTPTGDVEARFRMSLMNQTAMDAGFPDPEFTVADTIAAFEAGDVKVIVPEAFTGYGSPKVAAGDDGDTIVLSWPSATSAKALAERRAELVRLVGEYASDAEDTTLAHILAEYGLDLRILVQGAPTVVRSTERNVAGEYANAEIGRVYESEHGETLQCVTLTDWRTADGRSWNSPSHAARNLRAERDGGDVSDKKYNTNGKKYFNFPRA